MSESAPALFRCRLDAVAWSAIALNLFLATALLTYTPLTGLEHRLGPDQMVLMPYVLDATGFSCCVGVFGMSALIYVYLRRAGVVRFACRTLGWVILTTVTALTCNLLREQMPTPACMRQGPGGVFGYKLTTLLDSIPEVRLRNLTFAVSWVAGIMLAADPLVFGLARLVLAGLRLLGRLLLRGNRGVESLSHALLRRILPKPKVLTESMSNIPVLTTTKPGALVKFPSEPVVTSIPVNPRAKKNEKTEKAEKPSTEPVETAAYDLPPLSLLQDSAPPPAENHEEVLRERAALLEKTFLDFNLNVKVVGIHTGPVITQYEVALETGLRLNKVTNLADDLALNLKVPAVRVVAPLPGRSTVGIEIPNENRQIVRLKDLIQATHPQAAKFKLPIFLGKDVEGRSLAYDLATMPHLLIAGRTGTGKSVCLNAVILSLLYTRSPEECRMIMIDPKMVELSEYGKIPHLMHPVVTKPEKAEAILAWAVDKMEQRYEWLSRARVRNIASYNELSREDLERRVQPEGAEECRDLPTRFPYIVIIIDEVGDLLMSMKKEVESHIIRLAQKSRAAGIHVILATQKPTVDVITGLIKSNMPARICFQVASRADSMVVLDEKGADKLLGQGDMLFLQPSSSTILRAQGAYVDDKEIERTVTHLECDEPNYDTELLNVKASEPGSGGVGEKLRERDPLYEQAVEIVIREQRGSTSLLQRALSIGYGKASRFIDFMAEDGIVGPFNGSNARQVLIKPEEWSTRREAG